MPSQPQSQPFGLSAAAFGAPSAAASAFPPRGNGFGLQHTATGATSVQPAHVDLTAVSRLQPTAQGTAFRFSAHDTQNSFSTASPDSASEQNQSLYDLDCSEMTISASESPHLSHDVSRGTLPSLEVLANVLKASSHECKKPVFSHIWRHLVHRCGSRAAAFIDLKLIFHLSTESGINLNDIEDCSDYLSVLFSSSVNDYISAISDPSARDDSSCISSAVPMPIAIFLREHQQHLLKFHLHKMFHAILAHVSSLSAKELTLAPRFAGRSSPQQLFDVAKIVGIPFDLSPEAVLSLVNPFDASASDAVAPAVAPAVVACNWDVNFCSGNHQHRWHPFEPFMFTGTNTVRFPNGPIHCPTLEKFGHGLATRGYLNFINSGFNNAWSVGLVPVSSLNDSSYLWNSSAAVIGYSYGGHGTRVRSFPSSFCSSARPLNVFVGVDVNIGTCSFYCDGHLISTDMIPPSMFPCAIAICGHSGRYDAASFITRTRAILFTNSMHTTSKYLLVLTLCVSSFPQCVHHIHFQRSC
jgi:hypothetical protein